MLQSIVYVQRWNANLRTIRVAAVGPLFLQLAATHAVHVWSNLHMTQCTGTNT